MAWVDEDGRHEGYVARLLPGDRASSGSTSRREPNGSLTEYELWWEDGTPATEQLVPSREVNGWQVRCECGWTGPRYTRVPTPERADRNARLLYAPPESGDLDEAVEDDLRFEWEQHLVPIQTLEAVTTAASEAHRAQQHLTTTVQAARSHGQSWAAIGRAAGITRQTAHERWGQLT